MHNALIAASYLYEALDTPVSLSCHILAKAKEFGQLCSKRVDPLLYNDADSYLADAAAVDFLRKFEGLPTGIDVEKAAHEAFFESERQCCMTNQRLSYLMSGVSDDLEHRLHGFIDRVRSIVQACIGQDPEDNAFQYCRFGPGATRSDPSRLTTVPDKMSSTPSVTPDATYVLPHWSMTAWGRMFKGNVGASAVNRLRGNAFFTVPKDSTIRRACGKEPSINVFYQLAYGRLLREKLRRPNARWLGSLDLNEGQALHWQVAREASITGRFATIDLSRASDTISRVLVKTLLPEPWYDHLDGLRSKTTLIGSRVVYLEKFSSMGNGFTFELETLIFACILKAVRPHYVLGKDILVYGDDIIVPTEMCSDALSALRFFGFTPNRRKTFTTGPFRESCGGDFFKGLAVRPYFLKEEPDEPQKLISLCNGIRRLANQNGFASSRTRDLLRCWFRCIDLLPSHIRRCRGPEELGDLVIHDQPSKWRIRWRTSANYQRTIGYVQVYRPAQYRLVRWAGFSYEVQFASSLYFDQAETSAFKQMRLFGRSDEKSRFLIPRDGVSGYKVGWHPLDHKWDGLSLPA